LLREIVPTYQLFLVGGAYENDQQGKAVVVELYGRTPEGRSLTARVHGFWPYFYLKEPSKEAMETLKTEKEVRKIEERELWVDGGYHKCQRVEVTFPNTVPDYRHKYGSEGDETSVLACDIPFAHRFIYDTTEAGSITVAFEGEPEPEEIRRRYTTEEVVRVTGKISRSTPFRPPLTFLSFDIENSLKDRQIFCLCGVVQSGDGEMKRFRLSGPEADIIRGFVKEIEKADPDVITGYNIGGYDLPLLKERAEKLGINTKGWDMGFGRDMSPLNDLGDRLWRAHGRVIADAWWSARTILHPKQETLEFVSNVLLGEGKLDVDRRNMDQEWEKDKDRVMLYCERDAELALRVLRKLRAIEKATDMASVTGLYLDEGLNGRTSTLVDSLLIRAADKRGIGVPPTHRALREAPIEGGFVAEIKPQLARWVVVLDFKSMYPSIIISKNICFSTVSKDGEIEAPNGARFVEKKRRAGLIPEILKNLMVERDRLKKLSREAANPAEREYYDGLQAAVKVLMNSFYGVMASSFYRFTNKTIGAAITAFARAEIKNVIDELKRVNAEVLYSDTDSVFVQSPVPTIEGSREFGKDISAKFTHEGSTFEFQSVFSSFFSHGAKKRYVARQIWPKEELVVRGYETRRTDAFGMQVDALNEIFSLVLDGKTDDAVQRAKEIVRQTAAGNVETEKLVIARTVREESEYNEKTRGALPFLRVFKKLKAEGFDVVPGMKVAWIVVDSRKSPQDIEPIAAGRPWPQDRKPDYRYYAERLAQTLARVTEVFGCDETGLLGGKTQQRLGDETEKPPAVVADLDTPVATIGTADKKGRQKTLF
jgi:DNA polymerase I